MNKLFVNIINNFSYNNNMKNYNTNPNLSSQEDRIHQLNANQTVATIQNISKNIREHSFQMRQTMKALRESGAIPEIAFAIREGSFAVRDIVKDINETTQELKKKGIVNDTASAVENTLKSAEESLATAKQLSDVAQKATPYTTRVVKESLETARKETGHVTGKVVKSIKNKVEA